MKPRDAARRDLVLQWLEKSDRDLEAAEHLINQEGRFQEIVAFHCQQSVEKNLKALLVWHQIEFPKTHDIRTLLVLTSSIAPDIREPLRDADILTPFGVEGRYPGDAPDLLPGEEENALTIARRARAAVRSPLTPHIAEN